MLIFLYPLIKRGRTNYTFSVMQVDINIFKKLLCKRLENGSKTLVILQNCDEIKVFDRRAKKMFNSKVADLVGP